MAKISEQELLLKLYERIQKLEADVEELRAVHGLRYNLTTNEFSNNGSLLWNVCEPLEKAKIVFHDSGHERPINNEYWQAMIIDDMNLYDPKDNIIVLLPIEQDGHGIFPINFTARDLNVKNLLRAIYNFYQQSITKDDIQILIRNTQYIYDIKISEIVEGGKWADLPTMQNMNITQFISIPCNDNAFELYSCL